MKRLQLIWWGWRSACHGPWAGFTRLDPKQTSMALIPLELRRWK
jgi:hypothetical protein